MLGKQIGRMKLLNLTRSSSRIKAISIPKLGKLLNRSELTDITDRDSGEELVLHLLCSPNVTVIANLKNLKRHKIFENKYYSYNEETNDN